MDPALIKIALGGLVLLGCIGLFFGIGLAIAAHKFAVEVNKNTSVDNIIKYSNGMPFLFESKLQKGHILYIGAFNMINQPIIEKVHQIH